MEDIHFHLFVEYNPLSLVLDNLESLVNAWSNALHSQSVHSLGILEFVKCLPNTYVSLP